MVARRQGQNNLVQNGYLLNGNNSATYPYFLVINQLLFKVAGDPFFILITTLDISFFPTLSLSTVVLSIFVYGLVYGVCFQLLTPNASVTGHTSSFPCKNKPVLLIAKRPDMVIATWIFSLTTSCFAAAECKAPVNQWPTPARTFPCSDKVLIDPSIAPLTGISFSGGNKQVKY